MLHQNIRDLMDGGDAPAHAWPGGYPIAYYCEDGETVCADCINMEAGFREIDCPDWNVSGALINWEDDSIYCAHCNAGIPAAYTD